MSDESDEEPRNEAPGPAITPKLFAQWQAAKRGKFQAERLSNPVWDWLIRTEQWPYSAAQHFGKESSFPAQPRWCFSRYGMSKTELPDGRKFFIAGEHEDHYDPDFFIYDDLIVWNPDDSIDVYGYPTTEFPPTDFHSATLIGDELFLIGNLGYPADRRLGQTAAFVLNVKTLRIEPLAASGDCPGWIYEHQAQLTTDGIVIRGGMVDLPETNLENIDDWLLDIGSLTWRRLTDRRWPRIEFRRQDGTMNKLWEIRSIFDYEGLGETLRESANHSRASLASEGISTDRESLSELYHPPLEHQPLPPVDDYRFNVHRILVGDVVIRYEEDLYSIMVTVEGNPPTDVLEALAMDLQNKLSGLESRPYVCRFW